MSSNLAMSSLEATISDSGEAKARNVPISSLLGVSDPQSHVVEARVASNFRSGFGFSEVFLYRLEK